MDNGDQLEEQTFRDYLLEKFAAARSEVRLDVLFRGMRFDQYIKDPREKVGRVFQMVDKKLEQHGVVLAFSKKKTSPNTSSVLWNHGTCVRGWSLRFPPSVCLSVKGFAPSLDTP